MLAQLIALGIIGGAPDASVGDLIAADDAVVAFPTRADTKAVGAGIPLGSPICLRVLDPSDRAPYAQSFANLLPGSVRIASIERITMSAAGAAVGVEIVATSPCAPIISTDGKAVQVWLQVADDQQMNAAYVGEGLLVAIAVQVRTDEAKPRLYERTWVLVVRQL